MKALMYDEGTSDTKHVFATPKSTNTRSLLPVYMLFRWCASRLNATYRVGKKEIGQQKRLRCNKESWLPNRESMSHPVSSPTSCRWRIGQALTEICAPERARGDHGRCLPSPHTASLRRLSKTKIVAMILLHLRGYKPKRAQNVVGIKNTKISHCKR